MKKSCALLLCLCLLLSLTACSTEKDSQKEKEEEKITVYLVSGQKSYQKGGRRTSATMEYDEKGRPTVINIEMSTGTEIKSEVTYDKHGNKIREECTQTFDKRTTTTITEQNFTYLGGKATHCDYSFDGNTRGGFDLKYDKNGRLILITYDEAYTTSMLLAWHSFAYDDDGRLIRETMCRYQPDLMTGNNYYQLTQCRYEYNDENRSMYFSMAGGRCGAEEPKPGAENELKLEEIENNAYTYFYNKSGQLVGVLPGREAESEFGNKPDLFEDECYTFDKHGNLLSYEYGETRTEYTYIKLELTKQEAELSWRMCHGICEGANAHLLSAKQDPVYVDIAPIVMYIPTLYSPVYYLVPYPQWGAPSGK